MQSSLHYNLSSSHIKPFINNRHNHYSTSEQLRAITVYHEGRKSTVYSSSDKVIK